MPYRSNTQPVLHGSGGNPSGRERFTGGTGHNGAKAILKDLERVAV